MSEEHPFPFQQLSLLDETGKERTRRCARDYSSTHPVQLLVLVFVVGGNSGLWLGEVTD